MLKVNNQGVAEKSLPKGEYQVEVLSTNEALTFYYDTAAAVLTGDQTELEIVLAQEAGEDFESICAPSVVMGDYLSFNVCYIAAGTTHVKVNAAD